MTEIQPREPTNQGDEEATVAIYARTSSKSQQFGYSLDEQVRQCLKHCELRGWTVRFIYRDEAESGKDTDRPMFQKMMDGATQNWFDVIMFWKLDRFSRSLMHAVQLEDDLRESDVGLFSVTEQIDTTSAAGRFNFRNIASAAEFERDMIQQRTQMGLRALAMDHKWPNNQPPLGYTKSDEETLVVEPEEADLVRQIFDKYITERSMPVIADELNDQSVLTKQKKQWSPRAVGDILRNEIYIGQYSVGDITDYVDDYRIVPDEIFEKVTSIRLRFQNYSPRRKKMAPSRKKEIIDDMVESFAEYLDKAHTKAKSGKSVL